ncbi:MAG: hypothetical protein JWN91_4122, partial [Nocardioides sp.]|nr:hypothetical protein [Nocardioides sp.]
RRTLRQAGEHPVVPLHRPGPRLVPGRRRARASGHRPQRTPLEPGPRPHPAPPGADEPDPPDLRLHALHQTVPVLRRRPHHRLRPGWPDLLVQPRTVVPAPPPVQDQRRLELRTHRTADLPLDQPTGARLHQRPHPPATYPDDPTPPATARGATPTPRHPWADLDRRPAELRVVKQRRLRPSGGPAAPMPRRRTAGRGRGSAPRARPARRRSRRCRSPTRASRPSRRCGGRSRRART